jgi:hypothetical protein
MERAFNQRRTFALLLAATLFAACGTKSSGTSSTSSSPPRTPAPAPEVTESVPLALAIYTKYDGYEAVQYQTFLETGTEKCEASAADPSVTCTIQVDEARLYYGSLIFQFARDQSKCKILRFQPYFYRASSAAGFDPQWADSTIDCSATSPESPECYGGAAPAAVTDFPEFSHFIYLPDESKLASPLSADVEFKSGNSRKYGSNRHVCNDLDTADRNTTYTGAQLGVTGDGYAAGTMVDYYFACYDDWDDFTTYEIRVYVTDENSETGDPGINHRTSWKEL